VPCNKVIEEIGGKCLGFFDDITIYVHGNVKENTEKLSKLLAVGTKWARDHFTIRTLT
jgi:hypothetical protein